MNKNKTLKMIILTITFILITCVTTTVFAYDDQLDLDSLNGSTTESTESTEGADDPIDDLTPDINGNKTTENTTDENNTNTNTVENTTDTDTNTNTNTSKYEETDIPYAGPAETILMVTAFIVFAIIGIYTFIKLSQYSNI